MANINKVTLIGRLGNDPEIANSVLKMNLATTFKYKNKNGEQIEETEWHRLIAFGKSVEILNKYCKKGSELYIEGRIKTSKYKDKSGNDKQSTEIIVENFQFLGGNKSENKEFKPVNTPNEEYYITPF